MYEISVQKHIDAAHFLRGYRGKCESVHGHRFLIVAKIAAKALNEIGIAYDFAELKQHLSEILAKYDHTCLNDVPPFKKLNPSSENLAAAIYKELEKKLAGAPVVLTAIEVWESPQTWVTYRPD